jgi:hypothetical protein
MKLDHTNKFSKWREVGSCTDFLEMWAAYGKMSKETNVTDIQSHFMFSENFACLLTPK